MSSLVVRTLPAAPETLEARARAMSAVEETCRAQVQWWDTETVAEYRRRRREGDGFPTPVLHEGARTLSFRGRDGHDIGLRLIQGCAKPQGVLLHFHAGGFVIGSAQSYDSYLLRLSGQLGLLAVSVDYRLAPEHPCPAAEHDAVDAAAFVATPAGEALLGAGPLRVLAGESAGAYLALRAAVALRSSPTPAAPHLSALLCGYGVFDLGGTPSLQRHKREAVLSCDGMHRFLDTYMPGTTREQRRNADLSPVYADLSLVSALPPALFLCGTEDALVDDSVLMATNWGLAGHKAELVLVPGAWHAFTLIPAGEVTEQGLDEVVAFARKHGV